MRRAAIVLALRPAGELTVVARDAHSGDFVRVPAMDPAARLLALAPSGRELLYLTGRLCLHDLSTGRQRWLPAEQDRVAALSPDSGRVATLAVAADGSAAVEVVEVGAGRRRRLRTAAGSCGAESAICWSPDGRLIAASYLTDDDEPATLVTDAAGTLVAHYTATAILAGSNGTWAADGELVGEDATGPVLIEVHGDGRRRLPSDHLVLAVRGGRLVQQLPWADDGPLRLVTANLDGTDRQPLLTVRPGTHVELFGCIP